MVVAIGGSAEVSDYPVEQGFDECHQFLFNLNRTTRKVSKWILPVKTNFF